MGNYCYCGDAGNKDKETELYRSLDNRNDEDIDITFIKSDYSSAPIIYSSTLTNRRLNQDMFRSKKEP